MRHLKSTDRREEKDRFICLLLEIALQCEVLTFFFLDQSNLLMKNNWVCDRDVVNNDPLRNESFQNHIAETCVCYDGNW